MGTPVTSTATQILNRVAAEIGLAPVSDPYSSQDPAFIQMRYLLNVAGEELCLSYPWQVLVKSHEIITQDTDTGDYPLPDDFLYMINQTGWERSENMPLLGPLSAQEWAYLLGRDLVTSTIYASFRIADGLFKLFPQPPTAGLNINFEYINRNWVNDVENTTTTDNVAKGTDVPLFDRTLISRYLKVKMLEAKGFDSTAAQRDFAQTYGFLTGLDKGARVLNAGGRVGFPYLNMWTNVPDTRYGF